MFDRHEHQKTELQQHHSGTGDNVARDKIINIYVNAEDYKRLEKELFELKQNQEKLVQRIRTYPDDAEFQQDLIACNVKIADTQQEIEDFKADVFRLYEQFTRIPLNTERLRRAKEHFDKGEFREADAVLKAEEITAEVEQLQAVERVKKEELAAVRKDLADRANEFLIKARIALLSPPPEGSSRFAMAEGWFEQALATARVVDVLFEYAVFLQQHHALGRAESLYQEALTQCRSLAETEPEASPPRLINILNNLGLLHEKNEEYDLALKELEEALEFSHNLAETEPEAFRLKIAQTLNNIARIHCQKQEHEPALAKIKNALEIYRNLTEENEEDFLPYVALTLNNLAVLHVETTAYEPALLEYKKSLEIYRHLAKSNQEDFLGYVARTLHNLAILYYHKNKYSLAQEGFEKALKIRRGLAEDDPEAFLPDLTVTLIALSTFYHDSVPNKAKSVAYAQDARDILIPLCKQAPHLQNYLDKAEQLLKLNNTKPNA